MAPLKVALIGANGTLGPHILSSLLSTPSIHTTVLNRSSSKSSYTSHPRLTVTTIPDNLDHSALVSALTDHTALVIAISGALTDVSKKLINAARDAHVSRIIPADFGSCDSQDPRSVDLLPLYGEKKIVRDYLIDLARETGGKLSWTSIVCAHFLDHGLQTTLLHVNVKERKATVFDGGNVMFSASMLRTVGAAVAGVLTHLDASELRDRVVYVQSVRTCQNELVRTVEKVVGGEKFEVEQRKSDEVIRELKKVLEEKEGDHDATEGLVGVEGIVNADWEGNNGFVNALLGLPEENLESLVREALKDMV